MSSRDRTRLQAHERAEVAPARRTPQPDRDDAVDAGALHATDLARPAGLGLPEVRHLQRLAGNSAVASLMEGIDEVDPVPGEGRPLDPAFAARASQAFGADFADVRVHDGPEASASAAAFEARAYTIGHDIVQGEGSGDDRTMAHELAHVVQQRNGPVAGAPVGGTVARLSISDPSDDFEQAADSAASSLMGGGLPSIPGLGDIPGLGGLPSPDQLEDDLGQGASGLLGSLGGLASSLGGLFG